MVLAQDGGWLFPKHHAVDRDPVEKTISIALCTVEPCFRIAGIEPKQQIPAVDALAFHHRDVFDHTGNRSINGLRSTGGLQFALHSNGLRQWG